MRWLTRTGRNRFRTKTIVATHRMSLFRVTPRCVHFQKVKKYDTGSKTQAALKNCQWYTASLAASPPPASPRLERTRGSSHQPDGNSDRRKALKPEISPFIISPNLLVPP